MIIDFYKYHGHGNDFIIIDNRGQKLTLDKKQISALCHRRFGIGADGIILIEEAKGADYYMLYYNPDGSQSLCGNGSRCALHFAEKLGIIKNRAVFGAIDGLHEGIIIGDISSVRMHDISEVERGENYYYLNNGSPHYIKIVDNLDNINVFEEGQKIRFNEKFKREGTNVNFLEIKNGQIRSRVYERGVENETWSSGTGITATAIAAFLNNKSIGSHVKIETRGGILEVSFKHQGDFNFTDIWLKGKIHEVFSGKVTI